MDSVETLGEALPKEMAHVREVIRNYRDPILEGAGELAARLMEFDLQEADRAVISGDVVEMIRVYQKLKEWEL